MTSKEIYNYLQSEKGIKGLYKKFEKCFEIIDNWSDIYISKHFSNFLYNPFMPFSDCK